MLLAAAGSAVVLAPLAGAAANLAARLTGLGAGKGSRSEKGSGTPDGVKGPGPFFRPGPSVRPADAETELAQIHGEVVRMVETTRELVARSARAVTTNDEREPERLEAADESIDAMDHVLTRRLESMKPAELGPEGLEVKLKLLYIVKGIEEIADLATRELTHIGWEKSRDNVVFDPAQAREIDGLLRLVDDGLGRMLVAVKGEDRTETARLAVLERDREIDRMRLTLFEVQSMRVAAGEPNAEVSSEAYMNVVNVLRIIHFLAVDVVRTLSGPPPEEQKIRSTYGAPRPS